MLAPYLSRGLFMRKPSMLNFLLVLFCCFATLTYADESQEPLPADEAFALTATVKADKLLLTWQIADGYYLYQHKFAISSKTQHITLAKPSFPKGESKNDQFFGIVEIYRKQLVLDIPIQRQSATDRTLTVDVSFQGCADKGICYLPVYKTLTFD
jgi:thiol:disulfide interchange protein DsbD